MKNNLHSPAHQRNTQDATPDIASNPECSVESREFLTKVVEDVNDALGHSSVNVQLIAHHMCLTEQSFRRRLWKYAKLTPKAFFTSIQMKKAEALLTDSANLSVSKVALMCGFENSSSFGHKFKRFFGCSPSQYREQKRVL